jgi:signal transduction histidine kinase/DNA-binding response OmpR family regulator
MSQILVVDDDSDVARTLVELLAFHGYPALTAGSGEEALEKLASDPFDLVLLDARLPGISGFETCAQIRERHGPSLPVMILTAFGDATAIRKGHEAGADDFLGKPVDTPALMLKVKACLRFKAVHDETLRNREEAQARVRSLAMLHEIGRDWSLIAEPEDFNRMVTERLAHLIGAPVCLIALYDPSTKTMAAALPVYGMSDDRARKMRYVVKPEYRGMWNFRPGRPYLSNRARSDPRLIQEIVALADAESVVLVPMISEGQVLGLLVAVNKPGGFTDGDVQILSIFAGPAATFLRSRQIFNEQKRYAARLERLWDLMGAMAATAGRTRLLELTVSRIQKDLGYTRVEFHAVEGSQMKLEMEAGSERPPGTAVDPDFLSWASRGTTPLQSKPGADFAELGVPVRAGEKVLGVLAVVRSSVGGLREDETNLLSAVAGQLAVALQKAASAAETERLARQMATLYDVGLETAALRDLRLLFQKAAEESGRLIRADHTSVLRLDEDGALKIFAAWARDPAMGPYSHPAFRIGEGVAGRVARDWLPAMVNDTQLHSDFVPRGNPVARILCVPLTHYDREREAMALFGVLNATRRPGAGPFTSDDLDYITRFASQLSIAVANSMAFGAERERSEQLALVNTLIREIAGSLSKDRVLKTAVRRIHEAFRYPLVMIGVQEMDSGIARVTAVAGANIPSEVWGSFPISAGIAGRALREKRTILVHDVSRDPDYIAVSPTTRSEVAVPILWGDEVFGVLNVESDKVRAFGRGEVITLETLADGIGIILRNAELYHALERTNAKLVELDRTKSEVVNIVAHDFRAPLAGVLGYAELLEWKPDAPREDRVEHARAIIHAATHMASLVDKTLKTTRLETGHFPFEFGVVDLGEAIRTVLRRFPSTPQHPVSLEIPADPLPCWADRDRIAEVLENLLSNAVRYSPEGGPIRVEVSAEGETVVARFVDRGIGIAPEDLKNLFRPFSRLRNQRTVSIEGSGLGLYICERIVRAHGGRVWVDSKPGEGSVFSFSLPLFGPQAQDQRPLILVAAGDERTRRDVRRVAEEMGYGIHEVSDGVEAVEAAFRLRPSAVILDPVLPRLRAEEVAERLGDNPATASIPLFALATEGGFGRADLFCASLQKPLDRIVLAEALASLSPPRAEGSPSDALLGRAVRDPIAE